MNEDFTEEMLTNSNNEVDELCGCSGKEKTRSRRIHKEYHEEWCFYYQHVEDKTEALLKQLKGWKPDE